MVNPTNTHRHLQTDTLIIGYLLSDAIYVIVLHDTFIFTNEADYLPFFWLLLIPISIYSYICPAWIAYRIYTRIKKKQKALFHPLNLGFYMGLFLGTMLLFNVSSTFENVQMNTQNRPTETKYSIQSITPIGFGFSRLSIYHQAKHNGVSGRFFCQLPNHIADRLINGASYTIQKSFITRQCSYIGHHQKSIYLFKNSYILSCLLGIMLLLIAYLCRKQSVLTKPRS